MVANPDLTLSARQMRAARAALGVSQEELASLTGVSVASICRYETDTTGMMAANQREIVRYLESVGVAIAVGAGRQSVSWPSRSVTRG